MGFMMVWTLVGIVAVVVGVVLVGTLLGRRELGSGTQPQSDRLLQEQAERISELEDELARLREQADFTERLLGERHGERRDDAPPHAPADSADSPGR
jgi:hypothetical protein